MKEEDTIKEKVKAWLEENREHLPLNIDSWEITVTENKNTGQVKPINLGKYNAATLLTHPFYKPYSKMHLL